MPHRPSLRSPGSGFVRATALALVVYAGGCASEDSAADVDRTASSTPDLAARGASLFSSETFEGNGRACATCHILEASGTVTPEFIQARYAVDPSDPLFRVIDSDDGAGASYARLLEHGTVRVTVESQIHEPFGVSVRRCEAPAETAIVVNRGSPSVFNAGLEDHLMFDAREGGDLQTQALNAVLSHGEPGRMPTPDELAAIAAFQETLFSHAALEAFARDGGELALPEGRTESERRGRAFLDEDRQCGICHSGPLLNRTSAAHTDVVGSRFESGLVGMEPENSNPKSWWCFVDPETNQVVEGPEGDTLLFSMPASDPGTALHAGGDEYLPIDGEMTFIPNLILSQIIDAPVFKIPTLWGTPDTAPYFHDNSAKTLEDAVRQYNFMFQQIPGFAEAAGCDMTREECLDDQDVDDIVAYMQLLSFER